MIIANCSWYEFINWNIDVFKLTIYYKWRVGHSQKWFLHVHVHFPSRRLDIKRSIIHQCVWGYHFLEYMLHSAYAMNAIRFRCKDLKRQYLSQYIKDFENVVCRFCTLIIDQEIKKKFMTLGFQGALCLSCINNLRVCFLSDHFSFVIVTIEHFSRWNYSLLTTQKPSLGPDLFSRFDVYWIQYQSI